MPFPPATNRLLFQKWQEEYFESLQLLCANPLVMQFVGDGEPWPLEKTRQFLERATAAAQEYGYCQWPLIHKDDLNLVGYCGFAHTPDGPEVGWRLAPEYWGQGFATEASRAAMEYGFQVLAFSRVRATVQPANRASIRVMEKQGMTLESECCRNGKNILVYSVTADAFSRKTCSGNEDTSHGKD